MSHLFLVPLQSVTDDSDWIGLLGTSEQLRLARYQGRRRQQFLLGRALLRLALSQVVDDRRSPEQWQITEQEDLPPAVADTGAWHFSLSHSRELIAVLLSDSGPCGVDLEFCKPRKDFAALAEGWFHPLEIADLQSQVPAMQTETFYRLWTLKEAWLKTRQLSLFSGAMSKVRFAAAHVGCACCTTLPRQQGGEYSVAVITAQPETVSAVYGLSADDTHPLPLSWQTFAPLVNHQSV